MKKLFGIKLLQSCACAAIYGFVAAYLGAPFYVAAVLGLIIPKFTPFGKKA